MKSRPLLKRLSSLVIAAFCPVRRYMPSAVRPNTQHSLFRRLQSIQNAAAYFLTQASRHDHISRVLHSLHWLPVK